MNNINRENYETFFLLYTDNELSVAEKKLVDDFVHANPDLQEELVMLQQSILKPDNIVFDGKQSLLKHEFNLPGIQEKLLLYLDKELTGAGEIEMSGLIKADAGIKEEWNILQQTKLLPDHAVIFKDKQSLYRKEESRVIAFPWLRVAAAAAFIGLVLWGGSAYLNKGGNTTNHGIALKSGLKRSNKITEPVTPSIITPDTTSSVSAIKEPELITVQATDKKSSVTPVKETADKILLKRSHNLDIPAEVAIEPVDNNKPMDNNLPKPYFENLNKPGSNETIASNVKVKKQVPANNDIVKEKETQDQENIYAAKTSFADNSGENNNHVLFMEEEKIKKTKLGGFFRKVKRVLERNANIRPGDNNIKVANLEFAIQ